MYIAYIGLHYLPQLLVLNTLPWFWWQPNRNKHLDQVVHQKRPGVGKPNAGLVGPNAGLPGLQALRVWTATKRRRGTASDSDSFSCHGSYGSYGSYVYHPYHPENFSFSKVNFWFSHILTYFDRRIVCKLEEFASQNHQVARRVCLAVSLENMGIRPKCTPKSCHHEGPTKTNPPLKNREPSCIVIFFLLFLPWPNGALVVTSLRLSMFRTSECYTVHGLQ